MRTLEDVYIRSTMAGIVLCLAGAMPMAARAEVAAKNAWVRGTVAAQTTTGAFMTLTSTEEAKLVGASSPAAGSVEIHLSEHKGGMMHMQAVDAVVLPAGKPVELKPGGYHVMLFGLTRALKAGEKVPLTLAIEARNGRRSSLEVQAEVRALGAR